MLEKVIKRKFYLQKHLEAPLLYERESYLEKIAERGLARESLKCIADYLLVIIKVLSLKDTPRQEVCIEEIIQGSENWANLITDHPMKRTMSPSTKAKFFDIALDWLGHTGMLDKRCHPENNILSALFTRGFHKVRHLTAPMFDERIAYIESWHKRGATNGTMRKIAQYQLHAIDFIPSLLTNVTISRETLMSAADEWCQTEDRACKKKAGSTGSRKAFINIVGGWLKFMGRFEDTEVIFYCKDKVEMYLLWLVEDKGYSIKTKEGRFSLLKIFMNYLESMDIEFSQLMPVNLDMYIEFRANVCGCNRKSIADNVSVLRDFLRYAAEKGWCKADLDKSLKAPRIYSREDIPSFLTWDEMQQVVRRSSDKEGRATKRDHAIVMLLSVYGLRSSEVANLKLSDINWRKKEIYLRRAKLCKPQIMPLNEAVAQAILDYILHSRNNDVKEENIFLGVRAPYRRITTSTVYKIATCALEGYGGSLKHRGPHSYRHTCATHLINSGHTMKEVADMLGHQQLDTTQIYAKVDFVSLRKVSDMKWEGLL